MTRMKTVFFASLVAVSATACNDPGKGKSKAEVGTARPEATAPTAPTAEKLTISSDTSKVEFVGAKVTASHPGGFRSFRGTIDFDPAAPDKSRIDVEIDMASIYSDNEKLTGHLKSADFFDVEKFPTAKFTSTEIRPGGDKGATHTITGNLEMHGVTKSVTFPATINVTDAAVEAKADFYINRKDWNIVYPGMPDDLIKDNVGIKLDLKAPRAPRS